MGEVVFVVYGLAVFAALISVVFLVSRYRRCPPDRILVIFGNVGEGRTHRCIHGGGAYVIPLYQDYSYLSLTPIKLDINLPHCISKDVNILFNIKANFTFAIGTEEHLMNAAAERLLGLSISDIADMVKEIIYGQLRLTIVSFSPDDLRKENKEFIDAVKENIEPELNKLGLEITNIYISDLDYISSEESD